MRIATLSLFLAACGSGRDIPAADVFSSGAWQYVNGKEEDNSCDIDYGIQVADHSLTNAGDGTFVLDANDGTPPVTCTLVGRDYSCPSRYVEDLQVDFNAQVEVWVRSEGTFDSPQQGAGTQTATVTCKDTACEQIADLSDVPNPCEVVTSFDLNWMAGAR